MRLLHVARDISLFLSAAGPDEARAVIERRSGARVRAPARRARRAQLRRPARRAGRGADVGAGARERAVSADLDRGRPGRRRVRRRSRRSPASSRRGCASTRRAWPSSPRPPPGAWACRPTPVTLLRRAALAHDLGRVGVSNAIWEKPGPLGFGEWERVRLHPHYTRARLRPVAGARPDRARWPARTTSASTAPATTAARGGPALDQAARDPRRRRLLRRHARGSGRTGRRSTRRRPRRSCCARRQEGRLDPDAVDAVLDAAGHRVPPSGRASCRPG